MARISPTPRFRALDNNGDPLVGGKLYTFEAGTTTPKITYTTEDETTANTNPIILDANGYADVWLIDGAYKFRLDDANDVVQWTVDDIIGETSSAFGSNFVTQSTNLNVTTAFNNNVIICTAPLTLTLLTAASAGEGFYILVKNTSAGNVIIDPDGSETINGASTFTLEAGQSVSVNCDGTQWWTLFDVSLSNLDVDSITTDVINFPDDGELTISSGAITVTGSNHTVDTEADAATDDLDTINGGTDGQVLYLRSEDSARDVVLKHNTGNIVTPFGVDYTLDATNKAVSLRYDTALSRWLFNAPVVSLLDEDDMTSDSDVQGATQQSIRAYVDGNTVNEFMSSYQTITSGGLLTLAHGLGAEPTRLISLYLQCTTAEGGWLVNDVTLTSPTQGNGGANRGLGIYWDSTNVYVRYGSGGSVFDHVNKTTGAAIALSNGNWEFAIRVGV